MQHSFVPTDRIAGMWNRRQLLLATGLAPAFAALPAAVHAQAEFPSRPIRILHGYDGGSYADIFARLVAARLSEELHCSVIVEQKPGGSERVAAQAAASAAPDGYTLYMMTGAYAVVAATDPANRVHPAHDLAYLGTVTRYPLLIVVPYESRLRNLKDVIDGARQAPGALKYSTAGVGTTTHLIMEMLSRQLGISLSHIPYKGANAQVPDLLAGLTDMSLSTFAATQGLLSGKKLRALAITTRDRHPRFPDVPAIAETVPGFDVETWLALAAPLGLPANVTQCVSEALSNVLKKPAVVDAIEASGSFSVQESPEQTLARVRGSVTRWQPFADLAKG